jgi:hypothetical protein
MENTHLHYTNVCWYCGAIYQSNRSTSKYCSRRHNSLYYAYGSRLKPLLDASGIVVDYDSILEDIYSEQDIFYDDGWGVVYSGRCVIEDFGYTGPLPTGSELLLVGNYIINAFIGAAEDGSNIYCVKPFTNMTLNEKSTAVIIRGGLDKN